MDKAALITGGGRGIGEAIALAFGNEGIHVAVAARTKADVNRVASSIREIGGEAIAIVCDVTNPVSIAAAVSEIQTSFGPISILVNSAGAFDAQRFLHHDDAFWHRIIDVNLNSVYYVTKAVAPMMVDASWGRIINVASIASKIGGKYLSAYTAAKHGVLGLTRALAIELVKYNITVNAICPGYVDTPMTSQAIAIIAQRAKMPEKEALAALERTSLQNRLITPEEVARVATMLVSESARGITGQGINVDGGAVMY